MTINLNNQLSIKRLGKEILRRFCGFAVLYGILFILDSLPFLWPNVFKISSLPYNITGFIYIFLVTAALFLLQHRSRATFGEYGLSLGITALLLMIFIDPFTGALWNWLEGQGASFLYLFTTVIGSVVIGLWIGWELIVFMLSKTLRLFRRKIASRA